MGPVWGDGKDENVHGEAVRGPEPVFELHLQGRGMEMGNNFQGNHHLGLFCI